MRTVGNAPAAVDADKRLHGWVKVNGINRTGLRAFAAADAELFPYNNASSLSLGIGTGRAGLSTRCGVACETGPCLEPCRKSP